MRPLWKKALAAIAVKKAWDAYQERRRPSTAQRAGKVGLLAGLGAGIAYLVKTNRLQPLIEQVKGMRSGTPSTTSTYASAGNGNTTQDPVTTNV